MTFSDSHERLVAHIRTRMRNGELTERSLARHLGISQPHVNNVLRGRRKLSPEIADLILKFLHCSLLDLYAEPELRTNLVTRLSNKPLKDVLEVLKHPIGQGHKWAVLPDPRSRYYSPCGAGAIPGCLVLARIKPDMSMPSVLCGCDIALLDLSISGRLADCPSAIYVIREGGGTVLRWVRGGYRKLYIADEQSLNQPMQWEPLPICENQRLEFLKARVLWLGAEASLQRP